MNTATGITTTYDRQTITKNICSVLGRDDVSDITRATSLAMAELSKQKVEDANQNPVMVRNFLKPVYDIAARNIMLTDVLGLADMTSDDLHNLGVSFNVAAGSVTLVVSYERTTPAGSETERFAGRIFIITITLLPNGGRSNFDELDRLQKRGNITEKYYESKLEDLHKL